MRRLQTFIPSKDRPAQLDLLLSSMEEKWQSLFPQMRLTVVWRATTDEFRAGYEAVTQEHLFPAYIQETRLRDNLLDALGPEDLVQFLMDDDVCVRGFSVEDDPVDRLFSDARVGAVCLRMSPVMDYCYTENMRTPPPPMLKGNLWYWPGQRGDWGYPHSVDGSIWLSGPICEAMRSGTWATVSQLEPALRFGIRGLLAACYDEPRVLNVANNSVQDAAPVNRHAGGDVAELNRRFLAGKRLDPTQTYSACPPSPHFETEYRWKIA